MPEFKIMGIAVSRGRIAYAMISGEHKLFSCGASQAAGKSSKAAMAKVTEWISEHDPDAIVTEQLGSNPRKRGKTLDLMAAVYQTVQDSDALSITTPKSRHHKDKYREARALAQEFPELMDQIPKKPACWDNEPRCMILFEALSFALRLRETQ